MTYGSLKQLQDDPFRTASLSLLRRRPALWRRYKALWRRWGDFRGVVFARRLRTPPDRDPRSEPPTLHVGCTTRYMNLKPFTPYIYTYVTLHMWPYTRCSLRGKLKLCILSWRACHKFMSLRSTDPWKFAVNCIYSIIAWTPWIVAFGLMCRKYNILMFVLPPRNKIMMIAKLQLPKKYKRRRDVGAISAHLLPGAFWRKCWLNKTVVEVFYFRCM